jgi:1L-myo-inositol 1-phosphate cytidylyltransferase / CDP-L-myo-inositol myo-inositolphosphotransferase
MTWFLLGCAGLFCRCSLVFYRRLSTVPTEGNTSMKPENSPSTILAMPNLILLPSVASSNAPDEQQNYSNPSILGLSLMQRTVMAARRAGFGHIFFLARDFLERDYGPPPDVTVVSDWITLADVLRLTQAVPMVIAPATILAETDWLKSLATTRIEPSAWAAIPHRIVVLAATAVPNSLALLYADGGACDLVAVEERLTRRYGPATTVSSEIDPMVVSKLQDVPIAERRLLQGLVKDTDGFMARHFDRRISLQISRRLAPTNVTPSQVTFVSIAIGLCGALFFLSELWPWQTLGALLFLLHSIVDGCDGELARLKFQESKYGGILDFWGDNIVHVAVFGCMAVGWAQSAAGTWPLWLGAAAIITTLGSASLVYWRQLRRKEGSGPLFTSVSAVSDDPLAGMLDAASRRDFIYIVPILALFGKANWLLLLAAVGAPMFFLLLVFHAVRERLQSRQIISDAKRARSSGIGSA